jgi:hypothetical protein
VRAENEASNSDWSNTVTVLYTTVPAAPAAKLAGSSVSLNWTTQASTVPATQLDIERATNSGFTSNVTDTLAGPALRTYTDGKVVQGTTYYYRVRAENEVSDSAWSNVASIPVPSPANVVYSGTIRLTKMGYCLDDRNNSSSNGAVVQVWRCWGGTQSGVAGHK